MSLLRFVLFKAHWSAVGGNTIQCTCTLGSVPESQAKGDSERRGETPNNFRGVFELSVVSSEVHFTRIIIGGGDCEDNLGDQSEALVGCVSVPALLLMSICERRADKALHTHLRARSSKTGPA